MLSCRPQASRRPQMTTSSKRGLDQISEKNSSWKRWSSLGRVCTGKDWCPHPRNCSENVWMWLLGAEFGEHGGATGGLDLMTLEIFSSCSNSSIPFWYLDLGSSNPTLKCHIHSFFPHFQGWCHHFPEQLIPMLGSPFPLKCFLISNLNLPWWIINK